MTTPLIGIGCDVLPKTEGELRERVYTWATYLDAVVRVGGTPLLVPVHATDLSAVVDSLHGIILAGGDDISPDEYGEEAVGCAELLDPRRQRNDVLLARLARERSVPLLGICLGAQIMCVAAGGTLVQDIPSEIPDALDHGGRPGNRRRHEVAIEAESFLASIVAAPKIDVNSGHHQSIRDPGEGLRVVGRSSDHIIEAIEDVRHPFYVGVQWHPEETLEEEPSLRLFDALAEAAKRRKATNVS